MPEAPQHRKITVEDLLQLKRAEKPDAQFWAKFEVELRQKQLAALVESRPWWHQIPYLLNRRAYLPIGATAVLAFTLVSVRYYQPTEVVQETEASIRPASAVVAPMVPRRDMVSATEAAAPTVDAPARGQEARVAMTDLPLSEKLPDGAGQLVPWSASQVQETPSSRSIAANLAKLEENDPELVNSLLAGAVSANRRPEPANHGVEMSAVSALASRSSRLIAQLSERQFTRDPAAPEVVRERLTRRLGETELAGGWTRVGVKGDRVSLKF